MRTLAGIAASLLVSSLLTTPQASAQSSSLRGATLTNPQSGSTSTATTTTTITNPSTTTNAGASNVYNGYGNSGGSSMNDGAKQSKGQALLGAGMNAAAGAYWFSTACKPPAVVIGCILGAMHVAQAGMMMKGAGGAGNTQAATMNGFGDGGYDYGDGGGGLAMIDTDGDGIPDRRDLGNAGSADASAVKTQRQIDQLRGQMASAGIKVSADGSTVQLPDGRTVSASAVSSDAGLKSIGLSEQQIQDLNAQKAKLAAQMKDKVKSLVAEEGGGGGGAGGSSRGRSNNANVPNFAALFGDKQKRQPASVKGLSKQLGNDRIGVQADNIFEMISRQYQKEEGKKNFIQMPVGAAAAPVGIGSVPGAGAGRAAGY